MSSRRKISNRLVQALGFSKGWAELALKNPPPLVPSSLMASCDATAPPWMTCCPPDSVVIVVGSVRFCTTPPARSTTAATAASGRRMRVVPRTRSTQKLPMRSVSCRAMPRISAIATARPVAAETKFWTVRPSAWTV